MEAGVGEGGGVGGVVWDVGEVGEEGKVAEIWRSGRGNVRGGVGGGEC